MKRIMSQEVEFSWKKKVPQKTDEQPLITPLMKEKEEKGEKLICCVNETPKKIYHSAGNDENVYVAETPTKSRILNKKRLFH